MRSKNFWLTLPSNAVGGVLMLLRQEAKRLQWRSARLQGRNERSTESVVAPAGPVISMTTYGPRLATVHLALESIAAGTVLPSRLILWLDDPDAFKVSTPALQRLVRRGLEVRLSSNFGPHTKYYPYLLETSTFTVPLVTADDDTIYSRWWLEGLTRSFQNEPNCVHCYRAHIATPRDGAMAPYRSWPPCRTTSPRLQHFATGVSGIIYPSRLLEVLKQAGSSFLHSCRHADDVWLHLHALRSGIPIKQIWSRPMRFPVLRDTQETGLFHGNVLLSRNDEQIANTYTPADVILLASTIARAHSR